MEQVKHEVDGSVKAIHRKALPLIGNIFDVSFLWTEDVICVMSPRRSERNRWFSLRGGWPNRVMRAVLTLRDSYPQPWPYEQRYEIARQFEQEITASVRGREPNKVTRRVPLWMECPSTEAYAGAVVQMSIAASVEVFGKRQTLLEIARQY